MLCPPDRAALIRTFGGDPISCSTLQAGLRYLDTSYGYLAYRRVLGLDISLGPPICDPADRRDILTRFVRSSRRPILAYLRRPDLDDAVGLGLHCAGMGVDKLVDVERLLAVPSRPVASAWRKARRADVMLRELEWPMLDPALRDRLRSITVAFVARSQVPVEMAFLNRPMEFAPDGLRRLFVLAQAERVFGYAVLNPYFEAGRVKGYLLDLLRFGPTRLWGLYFSSVRGLAELLRSEGVELSLGFCPLWQVPPPPFGPSALGWQVAWMERAFADVQYLERLRAMKQCFEGPIEPRYFATHSREAMSMLFGLVAACGVSMRSVVAPSIRKVVQELVRSRSTDESRSDARP